MNDFTASNGLKVRRGSNGALQIGDGLSAWLPTEETTDAIQEFFRVEEDTRLGRWRWPENPDYVVYPKNDGLFEVLRESDGMVLTSTISGNHSFQDQHAQAARAYIAAHPEPKPAWHDAKPGEVWALSIVEREGEVLTLARQGGHVRFWEVADSDEEPMTWGFRSSAITAGRRIFPEPAA